MSDERERRGDFDENPPDEGASDPPAIGALARGDHRALARALSAVENRRSGYRDLVGACYRHGGTARVLGVTGPPGAGKSTLVDGLVAALRERDERVGVLAVDPSSPFSGGAVLGDRVRMESAVGDPGVFVRSLAARGELGGLAPAVGDAVAVLDAAGADWVLVETVGAGQNEVAVTDLADTVLVLVPPGGGDDVQMLKAGLLEVADCFVVNKADTPGTERTVMELEAMLADRSEPTPPVVETVATDGTGVDDLLAWLDERYAGLESSGELAARRRERHATALDTVLTDAVASLVETALDQQGGRDVLAERVGRGDTDPYEAAEDALRPLRAAFDADRDGAPDVQE